MSSYYNRKNDAGGEFSSWIPTLILLFFCFPVGVVLLIINLFGLSKKKRNVSGFHPYDLEKEGVGPAQAQQDQPFRRRQPSQPVEHLTYNQKGQGPPPRRVGSRPPTDKGRGLIIGGSIMAATFGFVGFISLIENLTRFWSSLPEIFTPLGFCGAGLVMLYYGLARNKKAKRHRKYLALIGRRDTISVSTLAQAMGVSIHRACNDLQDMLDQGLFPMGYLDMGTGRLVLTDEGLGEEAPPPEEKAPVGMEREDAMLMEIRQVNADISDPEMSQKINRIGVISSKIFGYLRNKPDKEGQLRGFLSYYLPTTLKILRAYGQMEAQGIEGENITSAKVRIEGMMDKVVDGFEKQLDKLFQDDAMDITTDVEVLERMLDKDGLGSQGMTLGG